MSQSLELEKQLKLASKTGSYVVGRREVSTSLKGSKLLVWSASANVPQTILDECRNLSVPAIKFSGNPVELGRACGIPFRVSVIALRAPGDADLSGFTKSADYFSGVVETPTAKQITESRAKTESQEKAKKEKKTKDTASQKAAPKKTAKKTAKESSIEEKKVSRTSAKKKDEAETGVEKKSTRRKKKSEDAEDSN